MEVSLPPPFDACSFGGDKGGNVECDVHRKVITPNKCEVMRGKFLGDGTGASIVVQVCTEGASDFMVG
eukprot:7296924-Ditylum_brightwellii.AAC.1